MFCIELRLSLSEGERNVICCMCKKSVSAADTTLEITVYRLRRSMTTGCVMEREILQNTYAVCVSVSGNTHRKCLWFCFVCFVMC